VSNGELSGIERVVDRNSGSQQSKVIKPLPGNIVKTSENTQKVQCGMICSVRIGKSVILSCSSDL
jgi:hypothetical protein